jgi:hypothetical protein
LLWLANSNDLSPSVCNLPVGGLSSDSLPPSEEAYPGKKAKINLFGNFFYSPLEPLIFLVRGEANAS